MMSSAGVRRRRWDDAPSPERRCCYRSRERRERRRSRSRSRSHSRSRSDSPPRVTSRRMADSRTSVKEAFERAMTAARKAEREMAREPPERPAKRRCLDTNSPSSKDLPTSTTPSVILSMSKSPSEEEVKLSLMDATGVLLTKRFAEMEAASDSPVQVQSSSVNLDDISVVIERNLPPPDHKPIIRRDFCPDDDLLTLPRAAGEGERSVFDRQEIHAFRHDSVPDEEGHVETRKVLRRLPGCSDQRVQRRLGDVQDYQTLMKTRTDDVGSLAAAASAAAALASKRDRGRRRRSRSRSSGRRDTYSRDTRRGDRVRPRERKLPDFSQRPNKGYLQPDQRNPTEIPRHGSYFLHDDRDCLPSRASFRGSRSFRSQAYDSRDRLSLRSSSRGFWSSAVRRPPRRERGRADLDTWEHDLFEEDDDRELPSSTTSDLGKNE